MKYPVSLWGSLSAIKKMVGNIADLQYLRTKARETAIRLKIRVNNAHVYQGMSK
jgi:hypothetical protein